MHRAAVAQSLRPPAPRGAYLYYLWLLTHAGKLPCRRGNQRCGGLIRGSVEEESWRSRGLICDFLKCDFLKWTLESPEFCLDSPPANGHHGSTLHVRPHSSNRIAPARRSKLASSSSTSLLLWNRSSDQEGQQTRGSYRICTGIRTL